MSALLRKREGSWRIGGPHAPVESPVPPATPYRSAYSLEIGAHTAWTPSGRALADDEEADRWQRSGIPSMPMRAPDAVPPISAYGPHASMPKWAMRTVPTNPCPPTRVPLHQLLGAPVPAAPAPPIDLGPLERAFTWPEPPLPPTAYAPNDPRHMWRVGGPRTRPRPVHGPPPPSVGGEGPSCAPAAQPPVGAAAERDSATGEGTVVWDGGACHYVGALRADGVIDGRGAVTYATLGEAYEGEFADGQRCGVGAYHHRSGVVTVGHFRDDHLVGVALRWSADRRSAWVLLEGAIATIDARVSCEPDPLAPQHGVSYDLVAHGAISLDGAWRLAVAAGLGELARAVAAPQHPPSYRTERAPTPAQAAAASASASASTLAAAQPLTPAMRQAAFMQPGLRPTLAPRAAADGAWPWPLASTGAPAPSVPPAPARLVEQGLFTRHDVGAAAAAMRVASTRRPAGAADERALYERIHAAMRGLDAPPALTPLGELGPDGAWLTPGASAMAPTPPL